MIIHRASNNTLNWSGNSSPLSNFCPVFDLYLICPCCVLSLVSNASFWKNFLIGVSFRWVFSRLEVKDNLKINGTLSYATWYWQYCSSIPALRWLWHRMITIKSRFSAAIPVTLQMNRPDVWSALACDRRYPIPNNSFNRSGIACLSLSTWVLFADIPAKLIRALAGYIMGRE